MSTAEDCWRIVWSLEEATNSQKADTAIVPLRWDQTLYDKKPRIGKKLLPDQLILIY